MPRLLLINPVNPVNIFSFLNPKKAESNGVVFVPPLGLGYIAAVTPGNWDIELADESVAGCTFPRADLVGITAATAQVPRAYEIARVYRERGIPVVMGGIHVSMRTEEALAYADAVVTGEAEEVWPEVIRDFEAGNMKQVYTGGFVDLTRDIQPRRDLFSPRYRVSSIMTSRGCPFSCDFCTVTIFNGPRLRRRPAEQVIRELKTIPQKFVLFLDDNLIGYSKKDVREAEHLFSRMIEEKTRKKWVGQTSINSLKDLEVLKKAKKAGCMGFFVGVESVNEDVLKRMDKKANLGTGIEFYKACIRNAHKAGIILMGNFVLGYEKDIEEIRKDTFWMGKSDLDIINFAILTPYPGTNIFKRLSRGDRIILKEYPRDWGLYDADHPVSRLDHLGLEEIRQGVLERNRRLYSYPAIIVRFFRSLWKTRSILHSLLALFVNTFWVRRKNIARIDIINHLAQRREYNGRIRED